MATVTETGFHNTINELGRFGVVGASECHNFGSTWGCRVDCPVFAHGKCKTEDKPEYLKMVQESDDLDEEEKDAFINHYKLLEP